MKGKPRKPADDSITAFVIDQLRSLGPVEARSMFGGKGLYWRELIFGLVDDGRVYFRVGESTVENYRAKGSKPFEPWPGHVMTGYWEVPADVLEDADEAAGWAKEAWSLPRSKARKNKTAAKPR